MQVPYPTYQKIQVNYSPHSYFSSRIAISIVEGVNYDKALCKTGNENK